MQALHSVVLVILALLIGACEYDRVRVIDVPPPRVVYQPQPPPVTFPAGQPPPAARPTHYPDRTLTCLRNEGFYTTYFFWKNPLPSQPKEERKGEHPLTLPPAGRIVEVALPYGNHTFTFHSLQNTNEFGPQPGPKGSVSLKSPGRGYWGIYGSCIVCDDHGCRLFGSPGRVNDP